MKKSKPSNKELTRLAAIQKMSKYAAITALGTFMMLNPQKTQANSVPPSPAGYN